MLFSLFIQKMKEQGICVEQKYYEIDNVLYAFDILKIQGEEYKTIYSGNPPYNYIGKLYNIVKGTYTLPSDMIRRVSIKYKKEGYVLDNRLTLHFSANSNNSCKVILKVGTKKSENNLVFRKYFYKPHEKAAILEYIRGDIPQQDVIKTLSLNNIIEKAMLLAA